MLLYWGMFTVGFTIGAIFSFITFAPKKPEEEEEYESFAAPDANKRPTTFVLINKKDIAKNPPAILSPNTSVLSPNTSDVL